MNTGTAFEISIFEELQSELKSGRLGFSPDHAKAFHQKGYWSKDRAKELIVDVSLELYRTGSFKPFLVWAWECKDYQQRVPVNDVEEFHAKLEQIGLHRTKGTLVCRNGFQQGALSYAEAKGIGLAYVRCGNIVRLLESADALTYEEVAFGLTHPESTRLCSLFYGLSTNGSGVLMMSDLIKEEIGNATQQCLKKAGV